jgi:hypothetical protein
MSTLTDLHKAALSIRFYMEDIALIKAGYYAHASGWTTMTKKSSDGLVWSFLPPHTNYGYPDLCYHLPSGFASGVQPSGLFLIIPAVISASGYVDHVDYKNCCAYFTEDPEIATGNAPDAKFSYKQFQFYDEMPMENEKVEPPAFALRFLTQNRDSISIPDAERRRVIEKRKSFIIDVRARSVPELRSILGILDDYFEKNQSNGPELRYIDFSQGLPLASNGDLNYSFDADAQKEAILDIEDVVLHSTVFPSAVLNNQFTGVVEFDLVGHFR